MHGTLSFSYVRGNTKRKFNCSPKKSHFTEIWPNCHWRDSHQHLKAIPQNSYWDLIYSNSILLPVLSERWLIMMPHFVSLSKTMSVPYFEKYKLNVFRHSVYSWDNHLGSDLHSTDGNFLIISRKENIRKSITIINHTVEHPSCLNQNAGNWTNA